MNRCHYQTILLANKTTTKQLQQIQTSLVANGKIRANARIKTLKENAFSVRAPLIFNALPRYLRESTEHLDGFKNQLDKFLRTIPDQPKLPNYHLSAASNSIIDQLAQRRADGLY
ncbi:hypothetical protein Pcinc_000923 [Petrolisthes cinctipes]|uniref:Uncharacterized protein n=1 Tax=Petrolisthes cinctipes TaxID=88211 RepID=A0AAE1GMR5_PETCI|nr:hypothetical protein Pcinc_000923 [Petrolisthes cinctipes]